MAKPASEGYWSVEERRRLSHHLGECVRALVPQKAAVVWVVPEVEFARRTDLAQLKASIQGGWSIWVRETLLGLPFQYKDYIETIVHEAAHAVAWGEKPDHRHGDRMFRQANARLGRRAKRLRIWPKAAAPVEVAGLFHLPDPRRRTLRVLKALGLIGNMPNRRAKRLPPR